MHKYEVVVMGAIGAAIAMAFLVLAKAMAVSTKPTVTVAAQPAAVIPTPVEPVAVEAAPVEPNPLHRYAAEAALSLMPAYADRLETPEARKKRLTAFAYDVADAVEDAAVVEQAEYVVTLLWIAHRETVLARNPFDVGDCDQGTSLGPWSMKEWRNVDRYHAAGALKLLLTAPSAWSLPSPKPWLGLVYDKRLNRPSAVAYLRAHPYAP